MMAVDVTSLTGLTATADNNVFGVDIAQDAAGDTYLAGVLQADSSSGLVGPIDLDPARAFADNKDILTSNGNQGVAFFARYLPDGSLDWVRRIDGTVATVSPHIAVAPQTGGIYFTVGFSGSISLGSLTYSDPSGGSDRLVGKFDDAGGLTWAKQVDHAYSEYETGALVADEARGRLYLAGTEGSVRAVVLAFDVANPSNVTLAWSASPAPSASGGASSVGISLALDSLGNPIIVGTLTGTADFDPGKGKFALSSGGTKTTTYSTSYVWKLNASGTFGWARAFEVAAGGSCSAKAVKLDAANNIYIGGQFKGTVDFQPGTGTRNLTSAGGYDSFVVKLTTGGATTYATSLGGASDDYFAAMSLDAGTVYVTGWTRTGSGPVTSAYVTALNANSGAVQSQITITGVALPRAMSVKNGEVHITGHYLGRIDAGTFHTDTGDTTSDPFWLVLTT